MHGLFGRSQTYLKAEFRPSKCGEYLTTKTSMSNFQILIFVQFPFRALLQSTATLVCVLPQIFVNCSPFPTPKFMQTTFDARPPLYIAASINFKALLTIEERSTGCQSE